MVSKQTTRRIISATFTLATKNAELSETGEQRFCAAVVIHQVVKASLFTTKGICAGWPS